MRRPTMRKFSVASAQELTEIEPYCRTGTRLVRRLIEHFDSGTPFMPGKKLDDVYIKMTTRPMDAFLMVGMHDVDAPAKKQQIRIAQMLYRATLRYADERLEKTCEVKIDVRKRKAKAAEAKAAEA